MIGNEVIIDLLALPAPRAEGVRLKEASHINTSLMTVIEKLIDGVANHG